MKKKDIILIVITIILLGVLIGGFIYDNNTSLLERTNLIAIKDDENLKIEKVNKVGFLYSRAAYEAKVRIVNGDWDSYVINIAFTYGGAGQMFDYEQYKQYEADALDKVTIKPNPRPDSYIWVLGVPLEEDSTKNIVYIVTREDDDNKAYIYMYYSKK